eukprot:4955482-Amphidinium_carterae.1
MRDASSLNHTTVRATERTKTQQHVGYELHLKPMSSEANELNSLIDQMLKEVFAHSIHSISCA